MLNTYYFVYFAFVLIVTDFVRCEPDYVFNFEAGGWLKLHEELEAWEEAFQRCHNEGAVLASPLNEELSNALRTHMTQFGVNGQIFLGTHDLYSKGHFASIEGVPLSDMYIRWGSHSYGVDTGDCLTMSVDGSTYYSSCKEPLPFICYRNLGNQTMNECGTFDNEYRLSQQTGSCYKVHPEIQTWTRAYSICASEGGHLVILNDEEEARIIKDMFPAHSGQIPKWEQFHIGLVALGKNRTWITIHGERIEDVFNVWGADQPDNLMGRQDRGTFRRLAGALDDVHHDTPAMFVCEKCPHSIPTIVNEQLTGFGSSLEN